jgi:hypothetical protein
MAILGITSGFSQRGQNYDFKNVHCMIILRNVFSPSVSSPGFVVQNASVFTEKYGVKLPVKIYSEPFSEFLNYKLEIASFPWTF